MRSNYLAKEATTQAIGELRGKHPVLMKNGVAAGGWIMMRLSVVIVFGN